MKIMIIRIFGPKTVANMCESSLKLRNLVPFTFVDGYIARKTWNILVFQDFSIKPMNTFLEVPDTEEKTLFVSSKLCDKSN